MILKGVGIGRGVAVGPVLRMAEPLPEPKDEPRAASVSAEAENARVTKALAAVNADLNRRAQEAANGDEGTKQAAEILQAVAMFASDPALAANIAKMVDDGKTGERAVLEGFGQVEEMFRQIGGYQGERAADLHDVGQRVIAELMGRPAPACHRARRRSCSWPRTFRPQTPRASIWTRRLRSSRRKAAPRHTRPSCAVRAASWPSSRPPKPWT